MFLHHICLTPLCEAPFIFVLFRLSPLDSFCNSSWYLKMQAACLFSVDRQTHWSQAPFMPFLKLSLIFLRCNSATRSCITNAPPARSRNTATHRARHSASVAAPRFITIHAPHSSCCLVDPHESPSQRFGSLDRRLPPIKLRSLWWERRVSQDQIRRLFSNHHGRRVYIAVGDACSANKSISLQAAIALTWHDRRVDDAQTLQ
jgi:hypothetical protein